MAVTEEQVREELKNVIDPELFVNIVDLGLVYEVKINSIEDSEDVDLDIEMTLTSPMCPAGPQLVGQTKQYAGAIEGVNEVEVRVVMEPAWSPDRMTDEARDKLNIW